MKYPLLFAVIALGVTRLSSAADLPPPSNDVAHFSKAKVDEAFTKALSFVQNSSYKIATSRRVAAGTVEIHERDTDVFYVLEGTATFVTGGEAVGKTSTNAAESRAKEIVGGVTRHLEKGDLIVIPNGVPHWFKEVNAPFVYLMIKITK